jgi:putative membrane protein
MTPTERLLPRDPVNRSVLTAFFVLWAVSCIRVPFPEYFVMQHVPTVLAVVVLVAAERRGVLDRVGFALVVLFLVLHLLGARYLYSFVPYDDWSRWLFGVDLTSRFGFQRNHYDRLVHICFGLLLTYPVALFFHRQLNLTGRWPLILAVCMILAASAVYEICEWLAAMIFAPHWADAYNGQQGDIWDAERDMACAAIGSIIAAIIIGLRSKRQNIQI